MFSFRQLGRVLAKAPIESLRTCQVLGSKIQNQDFSSQTHVPNVKSYFSPVLIPTTNQKYNEETYEKKTIVPFALKMAVGLVALSSNNDHEESPKTDATKTENDLFENYKETDLVLKTKHKKCLVCGVGDLVEENSEKEKK